MFLQLQGGTGEITEALRRGNLDYQALTAPERGLLEFVALMTRTPSANSPAEIDRLRRLGWSDSQIAEAIYVIALFAFFNRVADGFGLGEPQTPFSQQAVSNSSPPPTS